MVAFVPVPRVFDHGKHLELSAFLVIVRYTYRNKRMLKFSALVRAIVAEASIYFLAMIAMQIYVQSSVSLMKVWSFSRFPLHFMIIDHKYPRASINNVPFREYTKLKNNM